MKFSDKEDFLLLKDELKIALFFEMHTKVQMVLLFFWLCMVLFHVDLGVANKMYNMGEKYNFYVQRR